MNSKYLCIFEYVSNIVIFSPMKSKYLYPLLFLFLTLAISSCKNDIKANTTKKELTSGILKKYMDTTVHPGNDFMTYVNGTWLRNTEIPADKSSYGVGYIIHEESQDNVKKIIEESSSGDFAKGSDEQKVGDLYKSYMDLDTRNKLGVTPLQAELDKVDAIKNYDELATYFGYANK